MGDSLSIVPWNYPHHSIIEINNSSGNLARDVKFNQGVTQLVLRTDLVLALKEERSQVSALLQIEYFRCLLSRGFDK